MYQAIEIAAVVTSAIYGVLLARRHHMDFVGVFSLALIVAFGGGTLRDLFLDRHPLFWIQAHHYPVLVFAIAVLTSFVPGILLRSEKYLRVPDALGLGLFSVAGTIAALESGTSYFVAALLGTVTGTFGGVIGDIICNRVPSLFRPAPMFATCSFLGSCLYIVMYNWQLGQQYAAPVAISYIVVFRLMAVRYYWHLPQLSYDFNTRSEEDETRHG